jgi:predicted negative regulator of RcsB-dependent stress response
MAYDLEEQEQLDEIKAWWKRYGNIVIGLLSAGAIVFAGFQGWQYYQNKQLLEASVQYEALSRLSVKEIDQIRSISGVLIDNYAGTPYAGRAALLAAKANYATKDAKSAKAQLEWAAKNAREDGVRAISQLQLAAILLEEKQYDAALKLLDEKHDASFDGLYADLKGDVLTAQGKTAEARAAYELALTKLDAKGKYRVYTQHKLDALGS